MRAFSYTWSLPVTWQIWRSHHSISAIVENFMLQANIMAFSTVYFRPFFCSCDLEPDPMTFIYKLDPYFLEIYQMCKYELPMSRLLKVTVWQTYAQTDRHTRPKLAYISRRFAGGQQYWVLLEHKSARAVINFSSEGQKWRSNIPT